MSTEPAQKPKEEAESTRGLSPATIGLTLGAAAVVWMVVKFIGQLGVRPC